MKVKNKRSRKNEFRYNKDSGHPAHVYAKDGNDYKVLGITHAKKTGKTKNIPMKKNPNPKDSRMAFFKPRAECKKANRFSKPMRDWKLDNDDNEKMKKYRK